MNKFSENGVIIPENIMKKEPDPVTVAVACSEMMSDEVLWQKESAFHSISVTENLKGRFLRFGLSFQAGYINTTYYTGNIPYLNYFLLSYLLKPNAKNILVVGFGTGILVKQLETLFEKLERIDAVDIEENILSIASRFFEFTEGKNFRFHLQDALVYLRNNKIKYDVIIVDVAGNEGIDERFFDDAFFQNIKKSLKKDGIFAFNSCANTDLDESEDTFFNFTVKKYKQFFKNFAVFNGVTSDKVYYKAFFDLNTRVIDVTNAIFIASDATINPKCLTKISEPILTKFKDLNVEIQDYASDLHKIYSQD